MRTLRVVTLNIWNRKGPWELRAELIRDELRSLGAELVGLQEVLRFTGDDFSLDQAAFLTQGLEDRLPHRAYAQSHDVGGGLEIGNALLSAYPISASEVIPLPMGGNRDIGRSALFCEVQAPFGTVPVFVTHLNWRLHHSSERLRQVTYLTEKINELAPLGRYDFPVVLMGDFNAEPESDEIRYLTGLATVDGRSVYFADAWRYAGEGPGYTFDRRNPYAALAHEPPRRIDYIFVRGPDRRFRGEPMRTRLAFTQPRSFAVTEGGAQEVWPTDHFGVVSDLAVDAREEPMI